MNLHHCTKRYSLQNYILKQFYSFDQNVTENDKPTIHCFASVSYRIDQK